MRRRKKKSSVLIQNSESKDSKSFFKKGFGKIKDML